MSRIRNLIVSLSVVVFGMATASVVFAQTPITYQYFYDELGQLVKVVDSTGVVIEYVYDAVGNILEIKRSTIAPGSLAIFNFTPQRGGVGTTVTIQGQGFSPIPSNNSVQFNGTPTAVISATSKTLVAAVPVGATTGPISITVSGGTAVSDRNFTVVDVPVITSINPQVAISGSVISNFQVQGLNLTGATFSFTPIFSPPALDIGPVTIDPSGTSATFTLTVSAGTVGTFVLIASNAVGNSDAFPSDSNSIRIFDPEAAFPALASAVSVRRSSTPEATPAISTGVSVQRNAPASALPAISSGISVRRDSPPSEVPAISPSVSVLRSTLAPAVPTISSGVSVQRSSPPATVPSISLGVSVTSGPSISAISPNQLTRGASTTITINGANLVSTSAIRFIDNNGIVDSTITVSVTDVSADGSSITATVTVSSGSALGQRVVVITTANGHSQTVDIGTNRITIQ